MVRVPASITSTVSKVFHRGNFRNCRKKKGGKKQVRKVVKNGKIQEEEVEEENGEDEDEIARLARL